MLSLNLFRRLWRRQTPEPPTVRATPIDSHSLLFGTQRPGDKPARSTFPTVVLIGNCIAEGMQAGLSSAKAARSKYSFVAIPLHLRSLEAQDSLQSIGEASHVFVQQLGGVDWTLIKSTMAADSKLFSFPTIALYDLWPFDSSNGQRDELAESFPSNGKFRHFDSALARLRQIEPNKKKRIAKYRDLDFHFAGRIQVVAETQRRFLEEIDENSDANIGRFIARNYKDRRLFYDATHPSEIIFQELCEYAWRKLELPGEPPIFLGTDGWKDWSVPVHPAIALKLGVVWAHDATRYTYCTLGDVTWWEWVEAYVETFG